MNSRKISLSLPHSYLSGETLTNRDSILHDLFGPAGDLLADLEGRVEGIEISHFNDSAPVEQIIQSMRNIWKAGFEVILHAHLPSDLRDGRTEIIYPWLKPVLEDLPANQSHLLFNMHTLSSDTRQVSVSTLMEKTIENLKRLIGILEASPFPFSIAVEINREKGILDPSTNYENLVEICRRVDTPGLGIGWDLGHTYSNVLRGLIPKEPPREFVERVIHTHIHDLGRNKQTHWPLTMEKLPLDFYMEKLRSVDYDGYHTLEIYPERFINVIPAREKMLESIEILREW